ncbi:dihydrodipicolinate reductase C-terminal domain-containing protein [Candidatus Vidania fulgoroideorum]
MKAKISILGKNGKIGKKLISFFKKKVKTYGCNRIYKKDEYIKMTKQIRNKENIILDFSNQKNIKKLITLSTRSKVKLIIGTTGLNKQQTENIKKLSKIRPVFMSSNFNINFIKFLKLLRNIKEIKGFKSTLIETHGINKKDKPSGSAIWIKKILPSINISSIRYSDTVGEHKVIFFNKNEQISIKHKSKKRKCFVKYIPYVIKFLIKKKRGLYIFRV